MNESPLPKIDLSDPTLFGNDAAEDETQEVLDSYFVDRDEITDFLDPSHLLRILRAYRGEGKSAILRKAHARLQDQDCISIRTTGASLSPDVSGRDPGLWTKAWKGAIFQQIAVEVGSTIGMAWSDDAMALVEESEKNGFRSRSVVSSILDRFNVNGIPQRKPMGTPDPEKTIQRWTKGKCPIWLFVDDIDENFQNTAEFRCKVASFFTASRQIVNNVPDIRVRTGIRPNIWSIIRADAESLSKVEQYSVDVRWDIPLMRSILAKRIEGYIERTGQQKTIEAYSLQPKHVREERLVALAFEPQMEWGYDQDKGQAILRPPHVVMSTLSRKRPRWMIELAKAASRTVSGRHQTNSEG